MKVRLHRAGLLWVLIPIVAILASAARAAERELDEGPAPSSAREIKTPIQQMVPKAREKRPSLFPWLSGPLQKLLPFFADTRLELRYRTYYLRQDRTNNVLSEAWAMGGSIYYRSGWLEADLTRANLLP